MNKFEKERQNGAAKQPETQTVTIGEESEKNYEVRNETVQPNIEETTANQVWTQRSFEHCKKREKIDNTIISVNLVYYCVNINTIKLCYPQYRVQAENKLFEWNVINQKTKKACLAKQTTFGCWRLAGLG